MSSYNPKLQCSLWNQRRRNNLSRILFLIKSCYEWVGRLALLGGATCLSISASIQKILGNFSFQIQAKFTSKLSLFRELLFQLHCDKSVLCSHFLILHSFFFPFLFNLQAPFFSGSTHHISEAYWVFALLPFRHNFAKGKGASVPINPHSIKKIPLCCDEGAFYQSRKETPVHMCTLKEPSCTLFFLSIWQPCNLGS